MKKYKDLEDKNLQEENVQEEEVEGEIPGIYLAEYKMNNMDMHRIVVSNPAIIKILAAAVLPKWMQTEAVDALVERTPDWLDLDDETRIDKIKTVLTQETVYEYLREKNIIQKRCDSVEIGIDEEGSIVISAYYTNLNREQRRNIKKQQSEKDVKEMQKMVNEMGTDNRIVDLARKRLEKQRDQKH